MRIMALVVILTACRTPHERSPKPPSVDAASDAPVDAPADAAPDAPVAVYGACDWNKPDPANPRCAPDKMPVMRCRDINGPNARFPKCTEDNKVVVFAPKPVFVGIRRRGDVTEGRVQIIVDGGTNRGIDAHWRAEIVDAKQHPLPGGQASIVRVDAEESEIVTRLSVDQIKQLAKGVVFTPPAN